MREILIVSELLQRGCNVRMQRQRLQRLRTILLYPQDHCELRMRWETGESASATVEEWRARGVKERGEEKELRQAEEWQSTSQLQPSSVTRASNAVVSDN